MENAYRASSLGHVENATSPQSQQASPQESPQSQQASPQESAQSQQSIVQSQQSAAAYCNPSHQPYCRDQTSPRVSNAAGWPNASPMYSQASVYAMTPLELQQEQLNLLNKYFAQQELFNKSVLLLLLLLILIKICNK